MKIRARLQKEMLENAEENLIPPPISIQLRCTLYTVHFTLYSVHCTLYSLHCTLYTVHCTLPALHFNQDSLQTLHTAGISVQYKVSSGH